MSSKVSDSSVTYDVSTLTDYDIFLFKQGNNFRMYEKMGAHPRHIGGVSGIHFAVWAPNARSVSVIGDFNEWNRGTHYLRARADQSGIWEGFIAGAAPGTMYKYFIVSQHDNYSVAKGDPFATSWERPPRTASIACDLTYQWHDHEWLKGRFEKNGLASAVSIYEVHLGSWRRDPARPGEFLSYKEVVPMLADYCR